LIHGEGIEKFGTVFSVSCLLAKEQQKKSPATFGKALCGGFYNPMNNSSVFGASLTMGRLKASTGVRYANSSVFDFNCNRCAHMTTRNLVTSLRGLKLNEGLTDPKVQPSTDL